MSGAAGAGRRDVGSITDVDGIRVGQVNKQGDGWLSGVTVVLPDADTIGGVDVRGGGPGTHETDALDPRTLVPTVDAVVLTGGSAYGLASAQGAQRWCEEDERGILVGTLPHEVVPIVPAAAIFDLGRGGEFGNRPTEQMGYDAAAAAAASPSFGPVERGNVGAGTGGALGGLYKGGVGTASVTLTGDNAGIVVGAIVVVNAVGMPWLPQTSASTTAGGKAAAAAAGLEPVRSASPPQGLNTTIAVVATNAILDPAEASRTATTAHDGFARVLNPVHTLTDGDTIFVLATSKKELAGDDRSGRVASLFALQTAAAEAMRLAILDAIDSARTVTTPVVTLERFPLPTDLDWSVLA
ncbi:P1 family peptidase [Rhodoglobus sp. NPDC076762]